MVPTRANRHLLLCLIVLLLAGHVPAGSVAQEQTPVPGEASSAIVTVIVDLPDGQQTWLAVNRTTISDDDPPLPARSAVFYAPDAPLMLLYEGDSRIARVPQGTGVTLEEGEQVRVVTVQAGPASFLAVGVGAVVPTAPTDSYLAVGEPFPVAAGSYVMVLRRYDLTVRTGRTANEVRQHLTTLAHPALLYLEQGEITATPLGQDMPMLVQPHETIAVDDQSGLTPSDDGAIIVLVTLEPVEESAFAVGSTQLPPDATAPPQGTQTPTISPTADMTATVVATTMPTTEPMTPVDTDGDGLSDADEAQRGTNPTQNDSDGDGVFDGFEVSIGLDPTRPDTDGDGVSDYDEVPEEPAPGSGDTDGDGLTDGYEEQVSGTNPNARDTDGDGLSDSFEIDQGTNPRVIDSDADGVDDGYETGRGMDPLATDSDNDELADGEELNTYGTNPLNPDSDGDGRDDGYEVRVCGQDPAVYTDYTGVIVC